MSESREDSRGSSTVCRQRNWLPSRCESMPPLPSLVHQSSGRSSTNSVHAVTRPASRRIDQRRPSPSRASADASSDDSSRWRSTGSRPCSRSTMPEREKISRVGSFRRSSPRPRQKTCCRWSKKRVWSPSTSMLHRDRPSVSAVVSWNRSTLSTFRTRRRLPPPFGPS